MKSVEILEQRAVLINRAKEIRAELDKSGEFPPDMQAEWDKCIEEANNLQNLADIEKRKEDTENLVQSLNQPATRKAAPPPAKVVENRSSSDYQRNRIENEVQQNFLGLRGWFKNNSGLEVRAEERAAAANCGIRLDTSSITIRPVYQFDPCEKRAFSVASNTSVIGQDFYTQLLIALKTYSSVYTQGRSVPTPDGNDYTVPYMTDVTSQAGQQTNEGDDAQDNTSTFDKGVLKAFTYSAQMTVSRQFLQDNLTGSAAFESFLTDELGRQLSRKFEPHLTTGTGSSQPQGIVTGSALGVSGGTEGWALIKELEHAVDPAYRPFCAFMMHDSTMKNFEKLLDTTGRPLLESVDSRAVSSGVRANTLAGYPVYLNNNMAHDGSSSGATKSIVFGWIANAYWVRKVEEIFIARLDQVKMTKGQVVYYAEMRLDGRVIAPDTRLIYWNDNA